MDKELKPIPFTFDLDLKAIEGTAPVAAVELADGDLLIEGWGANYDLDREEEAFLDGAFTKALGRFLQGNAPLCYHHKYGDIIGKVVAAEPISGKGVKIQAIVDKQPENSPLRHIYDGIKKGRINGLSCGGIFKRIMTPEGPRIHDVDLLEWSATPIPVGKGTTFSVIAGKALEGKDAGDEEVEEVIEETTHVDCAECKKRAEAEAAAKAEEERLAAEKAEEEAEAAKAEEARLAAEQADKETEEQLAENAELDKKLTELFNRLDSFGAKLDTVAERWEDDGGTVEEVKEVESSAEELPEGVTEEDIESTLADMEAIKTSTIASGTVTGNKIAEGVVPPGEEEGKAATHSSATHPNLERSFRKNWVEKVGGFPRHNWIYRAAKHLHADAGMEIGRAIAVAVNAAKKLCATGDLNFPGTQKANPGSRAEACAAVAEWEAMKAKSHAS